MVRHKLKVKFKGKQLIVRILEECWTRLPLVDYEFVDQMSLRSKPSFSVRSQETTTLSLWSQQKKATEQPTTTRYTGSTELRHPDTLLLGKTS